MQAMNMERATMKIEIPFTDHPHCIGRQGNLIQSIMAATDTHIHFPDVNREPNGIKSNQVSITGTINSIELARKRIRDILPMSLKFPIPTRHSIHVINDDNPLFKTVRARFGVIVSPRTYPKTGDVHCVVRGLINQPELAEATTYLIQAFYGFEASSVKVTCQTEVSEQYHGYLKTRQQSKDMCTEAIEQYTHTMIQFPAMTSASAISNRRNTSVLIAGSPAQVCQARKLFDLCLPIILSFEIPYDNEPTRADIASLKDTLNVTTIVRTRKDKTAKLIIVQSQEYNSDQLLRARSIILEQLIKMNHSSPSSVLDNQKNSTTSNPENVSSQSSPSMKTHSNGNKYENFFVSEDSRSTISLKHNDTPLLSLNKVNISKKPSPIGHERSSLQNVDQHVPIQLVPHSKFLPPTTIRLPKNDTVSTQNAQNLYSTELITLLRSVNLGKYWSPLERSENLTGAVTLGRNDYNKLSNHLTSLDSNIQLSYFIDDVNNNATYLPCFSLLSI